MANNSHMEATVAEMFGLREAIPCFNSCTGKPYPVLIRISMTHLSVSGITCLILLDIAQLAYTWNTLGRLWRWISATAARELSPLSSLVGLVVARQRAPTA